MNVLIHADPATLRNYEDRGGSLYLAIALEHNGAFYPDQCWTDFGGVILDWWMCAIKKLKLGSKSEDLVFMDGPYRMRVEYDAITSLVSLRPIDGKFVWVCTLEELAVAVATAAKALQHILDRENVGRKESLALSSSVAELAGC